LLSPSATLADVIEVCPQEGPFGGCEDPGPGGVGLRDAILMALPGDTVRLLGTDYLLNSTSMSTENGPGNNTLSFLTFEKSNVTPLR